MILDVFMQFRKASDDIRDAITEAYPESTMDNGKAIRSISRIEGIVDTLESTLESRISLEAVNKEQEEQENSLRRRIDADWKPSDAWEPQAAVDSSSDEILPIPNPPLKVDYYHFLNEFVKASKATITFHYKNQNLHSTLQRLQAMQQMLVAFLNSVNYKK